LSLDDQLPTVNRAVVRAAQDDERIRIVVASFGTRDHVVQVDEHRLPTTEDDASSAVAS